VGKRSHDEISLRREERVFPGEGVFMKRVPMRKHEIPALM
jgi:hypothetical protein